MRVAAVQMNSTSDVAGNLESAERLVRAAAGDGAELVALPEKWNQLGPGALVAECAEPLTGSSIGAARGWARELGVALLAGSIVERDEGEEHLFNTSVLIDPEGEVVARYRKIHMFDVDVGGVSYRESEYEQGGTEIVVGEALGVPVGLTVCYDVRFPELYRILALRGALAITVPAAFTAVTGRVHWEVLLRARAIENQLFVIAPGQHGTTPPHYDSWGHSMIVDPWGQVLAMVEDGDGHAVADLDLNEIDRIRSQLPALANRRAAAYRWPEHVELDA
jgi:predicted amidohydrolase